MADRRRVDAVDLVHAWLSDDGQRLHLKLLERDGRTITISVPLVCLTTILMSVPQKIDPDEAPTLAAWTMTPAGNGDDLVLTLRTPDGRSVSFLTRRSQIEGMATIATHSQPARPAVKRVH